MSNVRGFYINDDQSYQYLGLRGLSLPGDYSTRFLLMINGHYIPDNLYASSGWLEQDFPLDIDLVERIEVIRGPSSALYGSNGLFATINVVTRAPVDHEQFRVTTEVGGFGQKKLQFSGSAYLGNGANLLLSSSIFHYGGRDVFFDGLNDEGEPFGLAQGVDKERGQNFFANLTWKDWSFTGLVGRRESNVPNGSYFTIFNSAGNKVQDNRSFFETAYSHDFANGAGLKWRAYYDRYYYWGRYDYVWDVDVIEDNRDVALGHWIGSRLTYSFAPNRLGVLTVGTEVNADIEALQENFDIQPEPFVYSSSNFPNRSFGAFIQQEVNLSPKLVAYLGGRFDDSKLFQSFFSPRAALIYTPSEKNAFKLLYGRAFRNPNAYEQFYDGDTFNAPNPNLGPEKISTVEATVERRIAKRLDAVATFYRYWLDDLIEGLPIEEDLFQFQNSSSPRAFGAEFGVQGRPIEQVRLAASIASQSISHHGLGLTRVNSPARLAKFRIAAPIVPRKLQFAGAFRHISSRGTFGGSRVDAANITDLTLSTMRLHPTFDVVFGVRNLFDSEYFDPVGPEIVQDSLPRAGRTAFIRLIWRTPE